ncbi:MAG: amidinotransferase [Sphingobacteriaceae bacterium]|jgi:hypothetical protein|nr:amidinotransferase [Sphingobacteriaceae bacterium]
MIRPVNFGFNEQTAGSNAFQVKAEGEHIHRQALQEFNNMVAKLRSEGIDVTVIEDTPSPATPDSIFPNNWISFHGDGTVYLYPMQAENRRAERRREILRDLKNSFRIENIQDLSFFENDDKFLEGTGSMVLDRENKIAYACLSPRTNTEVLSKFCEMEGYSACCFHAADSKGIAIYHTNVMMCIGEEFAVICLESIEYQQERQQLINSLENSRKEIVEISFVQMAQFAGNMLNLKSTSGESLLVMSERAFKSLTEQQVQQLEKYTRLVYSPIETIENNGGGSARCMIAEIHLPKLAEQA